MVQNYQCNLGLNRDKMGMPRLEYEWLQFSHIPLGLVWEMGIKWNEKKIILEYSSILLFGSFNKGNEKLIPLFGSLSGRK